MIDNKQVKEILSGLGADLCGIARIDRFNDVLKGIILQMFYQLANRLFLLDVDFR